MDIVTGPVERSVKEAGKENRMQGWVGREET